MRFLGTRTITQGTSAVRLTAASIEEAMQEYTFDLVLSRELTEEETEAIGAWVREGGEAPAEVDGVTLGITAGVPYATCTVRAESFDRALAIVFPGLTERGAVVLRIELAPDFAHAA